MVCTTAFAEGSRFTYDSGLNADACFHSTRFAQVGVCPFLDA
jgi:hypothetical protein